MKRPFIDAETKSFLFRSKAIISTDLGKPRAYRNKNEDDSVRLAYPWGLYLITACLLLSACGQKGDLYIPTDSQSESGQQAEETHDETSPVKAE